MSVAANAALIFWLSRSDQVKIRWPDLLAGLESTRARSLEPDPPAPRRRSLFVAQSPNRPESGPAGPAPAQREPASPGSGTGPIVGADRAPPAGMKTVA